LKILLLREKNKGSNKDKKQILRFAKMTGLKRTMQQWRRMTG